MLAVLIALFVAALCAPLVIHRLHNNGFYVLAAVPAVAFVWLLTQIPGVIHAQEAANAGGAGTPGGSIPVETFEWIPALGVDITFRLDALAAFMGLIVLGVGALVLAYCARYFTHHERRNAGFGGQLMAFAGAMWGLVTTDDLMVLYTFWEITSVLSFLLIGYAGHRIFARRSAIQALIVTTLGGLAMLVGLIMLGQAAGTYSLSQIVARGPELLTGPDAGPFMEWALALVLVGVLTKSAQVPFHFWLPAAMAAPTPVSAYLHAAAMVKAGIYLVARMAPGFAESGTWQVIVIGVGLWTMLVGGWRALRQTDIKLILAYGTVSQLGFLLVANGLGHRDAALAGLAMLVAHALFKAPLFMVVGVIDHETGTRDLAKLSGIGRTHPWLTATAVVCAASMAGIPPLLGFMAKESVLDSLLLWGEHGGLDGSLNAVWAWAPLIGVTLGSILTAAYTARFLWGAFATKHVPTEQGRRPVETTRFHTPVSTGQLLPSLILAGLCLVLAFVPSLLSGLIESFAGSARPLAPDVKPLYLALWHGITVVLGISAIIVVVGLALFWLKDPVARVQSLLPTWVDCQRAYRATLRGLDEVAVWVTGNTQRGSLSFYLFIILTVAVIAPGVALVFPRDADGDGASLTTAVLTAPWSWGDHAGQLVIAAAVVVATIGVLRAKKRFAAVLFTSVVGYGLAGVFALTGAPDLALTQLLVESILLVAMVLGLRVLPPGLFSQRRQDYRWARALLGIAFGAVMVWVAATALGARVAEPISLAMPQLAYEEGHGTNIVNVTLVDMRAWDTFGEITVLASAATGVASLIFIQQRDRRRRDLTEVRSGSVGRILTPQPSSALETVRRFNMVDKDQWLVAGRTLAPERRSIIFEVVTRLIFHVIILVSIYLLLAGHNTPGGGFAGGLIAGLALAVRYLAGGRYELEQAMPIPAGVLLGSGLAVAALSGAVPLLFGGQIFQSAVVDFTLPLIGEAHFVTATIFDIGVYLVVVGLIIDVLRSLGSEVDRRSELDAQARAEAARRRREARAEAGRADA